MELQEIKELMLVSIQVIGIFIAIIGGLVASKLLSMKAEKDGLVDKIDMLKKKIKHNTNDLKNKIENNYEVYKENEYDLIIDSIIHTNKEYEYDPFEYYDPYITDDKRKEFIDKICDLITKINDAKYNNMSSIKIAKDLGYEKRDFEYKIIDYYIENIEDTDY